MISDEARIAMNFGSKVYAFIFFLVCVIVVGGSVWIARRPAPIPACVAGPDEQCPSYEFDKEWREYQAIADKYKPNRDDDLKMKGLLRDLQDKMPKEKLPFKPGYSWDWSPEKVKFVATKTPTPQVQVTPPPQVAPSK
jgi:hypothetical protein